MRLNLSVVNNMSPRDAALWYVRNEFHVCPLIPGLKEPIKGTRGAKSPITDPARVEHWWGMYPDANIGLVGGHKYDFLDLDIKRGNQNGILSWAEIGGEFTRPMQRTPSGGAHVLIPHYKECPYASNFANRGVYLGMEMRSTNTLIVGSPSRSAQGRWTWRDGDHIDLSPYQLQQLQEYAKPRYPRGRELDVPIPEAFVEGQIDVLISGLPAEQQTFLRTGLNWRLDQDDSVAMFACLATMFKRGWSAERVAAIARGSYLWEIADRHATGDVERWLWRYPASSAKSEAERQRRINAQWLPDPQNKIAAEAAGKGGTDRDRGPGSEGCAPTGEEVLSPSVTGQINDNPYQRACQRIEGAPEDYWDADAHQKLEVILRDAVGQNLTRSQVKDLLDLAVNLTPVRVRDVQGLWDALSLRLEQEQRRTKRKDESLVFVKAQNQIWDPVAEVLISKDAFLTAHTSEFQGNRGRCEESYLTGADARIPVVSNLTYHPGLPYGIIDKDGTEGKVKLFNLYRPGRYVPQAGDITRWLDLMSGLQFEGGEAVQKAVLDWLASLVQHPGEKINHAILLGGRHGIGKDSWIYPIIRILGEQNCSTVRGDELFSDFNPWAARSKLVIVQEIESCQARDRGRINAKLKPWLAAPPLHLTINEKGIRQYQVPNLSQAIILTNDEIMPIPMDPGERRYLSVWCERRSIDDVDPRARELSQWFEDYYKWLDRGGVEAIYHWLLVRDISGYNPKAKPMNTPWTLRIQAAGRPPLEDWLVTQIMKREGPFHFDVVRTRDIAPVAEMARQVGELALSRPVSEHNIGTALRRVQAVRWNTASSRWWKIRNPARVEQQGKGYYEAVFAAIDAMGVSAAVGMTQEERAACSRDRGENVVVSHPAVPSWR